MVTTQKRLKSLISAIKPLYYVSRILGISPFCLEISSRQLRNRFTRVIWDTGFTIIVLIFTISSMHGTLRIILSLEYVDNNESILLSALMVYFLTTLQWIANLVLSMVYRLKVINIINQIAIADEELFQEHVLNITYREIRIIVILEVFILIVYYASIYIIELIMVLPFDSLYASSVRIFIFTGTHCLLIQYIDFLFLLEHRFKVLSMRLSKLFHRNCTYSRGNNLQLDFEEPEDEEKTVAYYSFHELNIIRKIHAHLVEITKNVKAAYGIQVVLEVISITIRIFIACFIFTSGIESWEFEADDRKIDGGGGWALWLLSCMLTVGWLLLEVVALSVAGERLRVGAWRFVRLAYRMQIVAAAGPTSREAKLLQEQVRTYWVRTPIVAERAVDLAVFAALFGVVAALLGPRLGTRLLADLKTTFE